MNYLDEKSRSVMKWGSWMNDLVIFCNSHSDVDLLDEIFTVMNKATHVIQEKIDAKYNNSFKDAFENFQQIVKDISLIQTSMTTEQQREIENKLRQLTEELTTEFDKSRISKMEQDNLEDVLHEIRQHENKGIHLSKIDDKTIHEMERRKNELKQKSVIYNGDCNGENVKSKIKGRLVAPKELID